MSSVLSHSMVNLSDCPFLILSADGDGGTKVRYCGGENGNRVGAEGVMYGVIHLARCLDAH
jgi:hypothetical protein